MCCAHSDSVNECVYASSHNTQRRQCQLLCQSTMCKHALLSFSLVGWLVVLEYLQRMRWLAVTNRRNGILNGTTRKYSSTFLFLLHIFDAGNCALVYYTRALPLRSNMDRSQWKIHTYLKRDRIAQKTHRKPQTNKIICPTLFHEPILSVFILLHDYKWHVLSAQLCVNYAFIEYNVISFCFTYAHQSWAENIFELINISPYNKYKDM